jgi:hypothetical protein
MAAICRQAAEQQLRSSIRHQGSLGGVSDRGVGNLAVGNPGVGNRGPSAGGAGDRGALTWALRRSITPHGPDNVDRSGDHADYREHGKHAGAFSHFSIRV